VCSAGWEAGKTTWVKIMGKTEAKFLQFFALRSHLKQETIKKAMIRK